MKMIKKQQESTITINVACLRAPPTAVDDYRETDENTPITIPVLDNDSDPENDPLQLVIS